MLKKMTKCLFCDNEAKVKSLCIKCYLKDWRARNKDLKKAQNKRYWEKYKEELKAYAKRYRTEHREEIDRKAKEKRKLFLFRTKYKPFLEGRITADGCTIYNTKVKKITDNNPSRTKQIYLYSPKIAYSTLYKVQIINILTYQEKWYKFHNYKSTLEFIENIKKVNWRYL